ncbi:type I toxin-antitoxin system ptaRNA1 family toxin [Burkholderia gladioli]|uniref:type I toxin-antitoxin system ptaRNA1 family toxin n=1 Tax=Burkholderia gladioli TaxID=28095 RepID=UPI00164157E5|nr:type I toxin-antitoxin system ptaRNA1 family toxin [Burkholderia gladioli]
MATTHDTEARYVVRSTAAELAALDFLDQPALKDLSEMLEAITDLLTAMLYQAETGRVTRSDYSEALDAVRHVLQGH